MFPWIVLVAAQAQTVYEVPTNWATVGAAVTAANAGDIVQIDASADWLRDYSEDVHIEKDLSIRGINGRPTLPRVLVDGGVTVSFEDVTVAGVNRNLDGLGEDVALLANESDIVLERVSIDPGPFGLSYGVVAVGGTLTVIDSDGELMAAGPAITSIDGILTVTGGTFTNNIAGAIATSDSNVSVTGVQFYGNYAYGGSDILASNTTLHPLAVSGCTFEFSAGTYGGSILATTADVTIDGSDFYDGFAFGSGGAVAVFGEYATSPVTITNSTFERNYAVSGGAVAMSNVAATLTGGGFTSNSAFSGGALYVAFGSMDVEGTAFDLNSSSWAGGTMLIGADLYDAGFPYPPYYTPGYGTTTYTTGTGTGSYTGPPTGTTTGTYYTGTGTGYTLPGGVTPYTDVVLNGIEIYGGIGVSDSASGGCIYGDMGASITANFGRWKHCDSSLAGGAVAFAGDQLSIYGTELEKNSSLWGGGIDQTGGTLHVQDALFDQNTAANGAAIRTHQVDSTLLDNTITANASSSIGVFDLTDMYGLKMVGNRFCANIAESNGAIVNATGGEADLLEVHNNVWLFNYSDLGAALRYVPADWLGNSGPPVDVHNNDFVANDVSAAVIVKGTVDFRNNIVASHPIGLLLDSAPWGNALSGGFNLWVDNGANAQGTGALLPGVGAVIGDPLFQDATPGDCDSNLWLMADSPARRAGDPEILNVDGGRSDIGAYGGPDSGLQDLDQDGFLEDLDCDDADSKVNPGVPDIPYDGIDNDCDGFDLCDGDGDGFEAEACGGNDCDDTNAKIHPRATDRLDDGLDNDCDGFEARTWIAGGAGCGGADNTGGALSWAWLVLGALAVRRRASTPATRRG